MAKANSGKAAPAAAPKAAPATPPVAVGASAAGEGSLPEIQPTHLVVRAVTEGFRRAGRAWSTQETTVPIGEFSEQQIEALLAEPNLVVVPAVLEPEAE